MLNNAKDNLFFRNFQHPPKASSPPRNVRWAAWRREESATLIAEHIFELVHQLLLNLLAGEWLGAEKPLVALLIFGRLLRAFANLARRGRSRGDDIATWLPVGGECHLEGVDGLQPHQHPVQLLKVATELCGVVDDRPHLVHRVDEEDGAGCRGGRGVGLQHTVEARHLHRDVGHQREAHLHPSVVVYPIVDGVYPRIVAADAIYRHANQLAAELFELLLPTGKGHKLGGTYRGEVGRVAEQYLPPTVIIFGEVDDTLSGEGGERGCCVAQSGHLLSGEVVFHYA